VREGSRKLEIEKEKYEKREGNFKRNLFRNLFKFGREGSENKTPLKGESNLL
jgi:hypothetical protein